MQTMWGVLSYFFENGGKKISVVFKQKRIRVDGSRVSKANDFENIKNYAEKGVNVLNQLKSTF